MSVGDPPEEADMTIAGGDHLGSGDPQSRITITLVGLVSHQENRRPAEAARCERSFAGMLLLDYLRRSLGLDAESLAGAVAESTEGRR